jgi:protein-tyrosine phosphatase
MLDLHCHILPGIDDGAATLAESLHMARFCVADGITHITATPHCHRHLRLLRADILPHVARLNEALQKAVAYRRDFEAGLYCHLGDGDAFTLLEFNWKRALYPTDAVELIEWLRQRGMRPIVAHPERHDFFRDDPARLNALIDAGAWLQVTVDSLLGNHGAAPQTAGEGMLCDYRPTVLATDAHNPRRCSGLSAGYTWVREHLGDERAEDLRTRAETILSALRPGT